MTESEEVASEPEETSDSGDLEEESVRHGVVTVTTNNVKEVTWPPEDHQARENQMRASVKTPNLSGLSGTVHMGRARRQMLDTEFENVVKSSSAQVASHPFTKEGFAPTKMNAEEMWSSSVSKHLSPSSGDQSKPRQTLKEVDSVLTQSSVTARSSYRMPPGTSRTKKCIDSYIEGNCS